MSDDSPARLEDRTSRTIRRQLTEHGEATIGLDELTITADQWRQKARAIARDLGRHVRTLSTDIALHAVLTDWPQDAREERISQQARARAMAALTAELDEYL